MPHPASCFFGQLCPLWYDLIVIDPPWDFRNYSAAGTKKGADPHYQGELYTLVP